MSADIIDANVFVHLFDHADETTRATASRLVTDAVHEGTGVIGFQVVQETLNVVTRNL